MTKFMGNMHISQKKAAQRGGPGGGYGCNAASSYAAAHGDPLWRRHNNVADELLPSLSEIQKSNP